jgi:hypothetical protein
MAMELFVLSDMQLQSIAAWQAAIDSEKFPLRLKDDRPFAALKGFLPVLLRGITTGFECDHWSAETFMQQKSDVNFGRAWRRALAFRWGGDFNQLQSVWMAAAAYAKGTEGIVFDDEGGKVHTAAEACEMVLEIERGIPIIEAFLRDIKRI